MLKLKSRLTALAVARCCTTTRNDKAFLIETWPDLNSPTRLSEVLGFIYCKRKRWRAKWRRVAGEADCAICFNCALLSRDPSAVLTSLRTAIKWSLHSAQISPLFINFRNCFIVFCVNDEHVIFRPIYAPRLSPKQNELSNFVCTKKKRSYAKTKWQN